MSTINFQTKLFQIGDLTILRLPESASAKLPSRGILMVAGTINGTSFETPLEPDGKGSHWFEVDRALGKAAGIKTGDTAQLEIEAIKKWIEPEVPKDIMSALAADPKAYAQWAEVTTMARWEWIRWIRSTNSAETRKKRIGVACSKLRSGMRRPCCFNSSMCTVPSVSKQGILLEMAEAAA